MIEEVKKILFDPKNWVDHPFQIGDITLHDYHVESIFREIESSFTETFEAGEGIVFDISKLGWQALKKGVK